MIMLKIRRDDGSLIHEEPIDDAHFSEDWTTYYAYAAWDPTSGLLLAWGLNDLDRRELPAPPGSLAGQGGIVLDLSAAGVSLADVFEVDLYYDNEGGPVVYVRAREEGSGAYILPVNALPDRTDPNCPVDHTVPGEDFKWNPGGLGGGFWKINLDSSPTDTMDIFARITIDGQSTIEKSLGGAWTFKRWHFHDRNTDSPFSTLVDPDRDSGNPLTVPQDGYYWVDAYFASSVEKPPLTLDGVTLLFGLGDAGGYYWSLIDLLNGIFNPKPVPPFPPEDLERNMREVIGSLTPTQLVELEVLSERLSSAHRRLSVAIQDIKKRKP